MQGLAVYKGKKIGEFAKRIGEFHEGRGFQVGKWQHEDTLLMRVTLPTFSKRDKGAVFTDSESGCTAIVDGFFREDWNGNLQDNLSKLAVSLYSTHGPEFVTKICGEFVIAIHDPRDNSLRIFNDRYALRPLYCANHSNSYMAASGPAVILNSGFIEPKLNESNALTLLTYFRLRLGEETIFSGVDWLPPASVLRIQDLDGGLNLHHKTYWEFIYSEDKEYTVTDDKIDELADIYRRSTWRSVNALGDKPCLALSGGLDSRSIVAAMDRDARARVGAVTWGNYESDECLLARRVAEVGGIDFDLVPLISLDFVDHADSSFDFNDDFDLFVQGQTAKGCRFASGHYDSMMMGLNLDITLGARMINSQIMEAKSDTDVFNLVKSLNCHKPYIFEKGLYSEDLAKRNAKLNDEKIRSLISQIPQAGGPAKYEYFFIRYHVNRLIFVRYRFYRNFLEASNPPYDYEFVDSFRKIPIQERYQQKTLRPWLMKLSPELSRIPYQRNGLPPTVPTEYWPTANRLALEKRKFYDQISYETKGKSLVTENRHYSDWLQWSRTDPWFKEYLEDVVLNSNSAIYQMGIGNLKEARSTWNAHLAGDQDSIHMFLHFVSLDKFLTKYF